MYFYRWLVHSVLFFLHEHAGDLQVIVLAIYLFFYLPFSVIGSSSFSVLLPIDSIIFSEALKKAQANN